MLNPDQFLYHEASSEHRASIERLGLRPDQEQSGAVWFFSDPERLTGVSSSDVWEVRAGDVPNIEHGSSWSAEWGTDDPVYATASEVKVRRRE